MSASEPKKLSVFTGWLENGPWRSRTVLVALVVFFVGLWFWYSDIRNSPPQNESDTATASATEPAPDGSVAKPGKPFPGYALASASYIVGYCVGWLFRRLLRLILVISALVFALLAYGKYSGFNLKPAEEQVKRGSEWAQHEAAAAKDYLKHMLPSAAAGGVGMFLGFLRRKKAGTAQSGA